MEVEIREFNKEWAADFAALNYEWIERFFSVEKHDREILDDPQTYVIAPSGQIFMAVCNGVAAGTVAMIPAGESVFELTKMAVSPEFQGKGIANYLMIASINFAREKHAKMIFLESHRKLQPALALYRKFGFVEVPTDPNSEYARADIRMELAIGDDNM
ncbi:MAG TPA: GNAT family N-acetyltransferase [Pyrinomonadaceae bacterium]|nr:GNAT family N-acetyltransferase [Pyrinomonadaceae bacterium]